MLPLLFVAGGYLENLFLATRSTAIMNFILASLVDCMQTLQNHFLLAMPSLSDPYFNRALVYLCQHNEEGAMGMVVNIAVDMAVETLLGQLKLTPPAHPSLKQSVLQGGPVHSDRGFVLHSHHPGFKSTLKVSDEVMITTSKDILETLGSEHAPAHWLMTLGYAGWGAGQLEQELIDGAWLVIPPNPDLLFHTPMHRRWQQAAISIGVNPIHLSSEIGHG